MEQDIIQTAFTFSADKLLSMVFAFTADIIVLISILNFIYKKFNSSREYLFTFGIFNIVIFLICFLLSSATLSIGFSFGLFAIFSILRYRTVAIPIKEMTYFFLSISIAIINSLSTTTISVYEMIFADIMIIAATLLFEFLWKNKDLMKYIKYEKIDLIKPENHSELLKDLRNRTGLDIHRFEVGRIDFLRDIADLRVFYKSNNGHFVNENIVDDDDDD